MHSFAEMFGRVRKQREFFQSLTVNEMREKLKAKGIKAPSKMRKLELAKLLASV